MLYYKSITFNLFYIFVVSFISVPYTNGNSINEYRKMFPKLGENVTLKCEFNNMINSTVFWNIHHKELPGRAKILKNGNLFISSFNTTDAGIYICDRAAGNETSIEFELISKSIPGSLLDVKVIPYSVLILITWREIENNDTYPVKYITIRYRIVDGGYASNSWNVLKVNPSKVQKEIYSLRPNTHYKIQLSVSNEIGEGAITELTTKTLNDLTETELEKHLLEGIDTFDTRAWTFAVIVIMSTFSIFGIALCCLFIKDPRMQKSTVKYMVHRDNCI
ncbi:Hypothetical protein CINCED_3A013684 [Cinara cedri]|uniref:Fibronectin type III,Immunoglobulin subtype,Immunoglobulin-like domain,Immunoglobulin-like n=1 Tax=Cinara cedri TaxID=506608 RepID=A0A5E4N390_9HEMI|nr:Hypothetical protein CINCED_3A013684 [Cinara cedri]